MDNSKGPSVITLAIMPMQNMSDNPTIEMFCTGLVMDLITDLSRLRTFQIVPYDITRQFSTTEEGGRLDLHRLGVDYLVEGLVRYYQERLVFNLQLINVKQNRLVWAEKFSGSLEEIFVVEEEIVQKIVSTLQHVVDQDLIGAIRKKNITHLSAYECWIKGLQELKKGNLEADDTARQYFQKALEVDPHYARAYTGMSLTYFNEWSCQIWDRWEVSQKGALEWAHKAIELDEWDHVSTAILGRLYLFKGDYDKAEYYLQRALQLNPHDASNLIQIAYAFVYLGHLEQAFQLYIKAVQLHPKGESAYYDCGALIYFEMGQFDEAIALTEKHPPGRGWVDFPAFVAAIYFHKGDWTKSSEYWQLFLQQFAQKINQGKTADTATAVKWMADVNPYKGYTQLTPFWEFLLRDSDSIVTPPAGNSPSQFNQFVCSGTLWTLSFAGKTVQIQELKGFHDLAKLLAQPNTAVHCAELMGAAILEQGEALFDEKAKKAYQQKILALQQDIREAEQFHDHSRIAALQREYDQLLDYLAKSLGMDGKPRQVAGTVEKTRSAITWRIRYAINKISAVHPQLGKHLEVSVKTGLFCVYSPEHELNWMT